MIIETHKSILENGLRIQIHPDFSTPLVAVNLLYDVGSKDEDPEMTGFAHLFEHLMFGGTSSVPDFDSRLQMAGGECNAFTNSDFTNYYTTIPADNIETALWLESDRISNPNLSDENLEVQKSVVSEEYRQRYLNKPYGDAMLLLRPLTYNIHPYRWPTIGKDISHIEKANPESVRDFFRKHYSINNAILTIAGNIDHNKAIILTEKWFGNIKPGIKNAGVLPQEPQRNEPARLMVTRDVPANAIYKSWVISKRGDPAFHVFDMITDILAGGDSGRLFALLVREKRIFSDINAYVTGENDRGMLIITGHVADGVSMETAEEAINTEIYKLQTKPVSEREMRKVKNRFESSFHMTHTGILAKAISLSLHELIGKAEDINKQTENYSLVTPEMIMAETSGSLTYNSASTLWYMKERI